MRSGHGGQGFNLSSQNPRDHRCGLIAEERDRLSKAGLPNTSTVGSNTTRLKFGTLASALVSHDVIRLEIARSFCGSTQWWWVEEKDVRLAGEETGHIGWLEAVG